MHNLKNTKFLLPKFITKFSQRFILYYKNLSIIKKMSFSFVITIISMIILSYCDFYFYKLDKSKNTISAVHQLNTQAIKEINSHINDMSSLSKLPLYYLNQHTIDELEKTNDNPTKFLSIQDDLQKIIENIFAIKNNIQSIFIFNRYGYSVYRLKSGTLNQDYNPANNAWFRNSLKSSGEHIFIPTFQISNLQDYTFDTPYVFSVARPLINYDTANVAGLIMINSNIDVLSNILNELLIYEGQRLILCNDDNYIIYDSLSNRIGTYMDRTEINLLAKLKENPTYSTKFNSTKSIITFEESLDNNLHLINIIPSQSLNKDINIIKFATTIVTLILLIIVVLLTLFTSKKILVPLKRLLTIMRVVEKGNLDIKVPVTCNDEIGELSKTFNSMTSKIKDLIDKEYIEQLNKKELMLQMLQNQINPHFIYNTLESIHMMAEINNDKEASLMSTTLGSIMRYGLNQQNKIVTVKEELLHLEQYIYLQKLRFDNLDDVIIDVPEEFMHIPLIKLIFQPIVENSLYHGISTLEYGGIIKVIAYEDADNLIFQIIDNGLGIDDLNLKSLNDYINDLNSHYNSIGLKNVNQRIKLHYGKNYGIDIFSTLNLGTTVKITIPK